MTYDELYQNAGDYTGVFTNLVLEKDINWNVVGVLANLMKCDKIGVVVSTRSLAEHCNIALSTVLSAIGVLREKGIISNKKVGYTVNYDALYNLVIECNKRSKEMTKNSKTAENQPKSVSKNMTPNDEGVSKNMTEVYRKSVQECTEKHDNNIYNINNKNNKPKNFICNNQGYCNTEVKQNIINKKKQYIVPKVLKVFTEFDKNSISVFSSSFSSVEGEGTKVNNTPSAERLNSLRSRVEVAKKELLSEFETIVQGAEGYIAAVNACYFKWDEYRERIVKAAINPKRLEEEYQMLSDYFIDSCRLHTKYEEMAADKFIGTCLQPSSVNGSLEQAIDGYQKNNKRATA